MASKERTKLSFQSILKVERLMVLKRGIKGHV